MTKPNTPFQKAVDESIKEVDKSMGKTMVVYNIFVVKQLRDNSEYHFSSTEEVIYES